MFKLRFKERAYIISCKNTYEDIINEIQKKIKNLSCCTINYIFYNDYFQETKLFTPESVNKLNNQEKKIIEVELNLNERNLKVFYENFYLRLFKKIRLVLLSQAKLKCIDRRKERAYRLNNQLKMNLSLIKLSSQKQNKSSLFTSLKINKLFPNDIPFNEKLSLLSQLSRINSKSFSNIITISNNSMSTEKKIWNCNNPNCRKEIKDIRYLCGICKANFNQEYYLCKSCTKIKSFHCHTQGFVEIDVTTKDFEEEEQRFLIKQTMTQNNQQEQSNIYKGIYNTLISPSVSFNNTLYEK